MLEFTILKTSRRSRARLGILKTPHGEVMTPSLVPVATNATIKALRSDEVIATGTQMLISNTYHLHLAGIAKKGVPQGEKMIAAGGGLNKFMQWSRPTMTDSGGFQVFSLGFGRDLGVGKFETTHGGAAAARGPKTFPSKLEKAAAARAVDRGAQPNEVKIDDDGVRFRSPLTGEQLFLGPRESMAIQEKIGADIIFAFDECTPPRVTREYMTRSLERTHRWARIGIAAKKSDQALYGIVQGSVFKDLRQASARYIAKLGGGRDGAFSGFGIGGDLGDTIANGSATIAARGGSGSTAGAGRSANRVGTRQVLDWTIPLLDQRKPRHLLGIGKLEDIETIVKAGVDTFDCTVPTHYARRGIAFTSVGKVDFNKAALLRDKNPIDPTCDCLVCAIYRRNYIAHLIRAGEITGGALLTFHNLYFFNAEVAKVREKIRRGMI